MASRSTALVTGASSGIGREIARLHAAAGGDLILVARSTSKLRALSEELSAMYDVEVHVIPKDLSIPDAALELYEAVRQKHIEVDYLFNMAGFGDYGPFDKAEWDRIEMMMNVNMLTLTHLTYLFGIDMLRRGHGGILHVAAAASPEPEKLAVYQATKEYVRTFSESLSKDWGRRGVRITTLSPGPTDTDFFRSAGIPQPDQSMESAAVVAARGYEHLTTTVKPTRKRAEEGVIETALRWLPKTLRQGLGRDPSGKSSG